MTLSYEVSEVAPYINWAYFYFAWQVKQEEEQQCLRKEAEAMLAAFEGTYRCHALFQLFNAYSEDDDVVLEGAVSGEGCTAFGEGRIPFLRQQQVDSDHLCLADFIAPKTTAVANSHLSPLTSPLSPLSSLALFATSVDSGLEHDFDADPYQKMMAQLLADRLAEATAERLHEQVRKQLWGYAPDERLSIAEMQQERFQGIRPAVGYPSLPDASLNFLLDRLLGFRQIGITLTESGAMRPHASVSGLMMAHPEARYFAVGKIGQDQLRDYACRRGLPVETMRKFLSSNL
ncbi:MAG: 5-methyltetrahydrofolate--homocysteine methyltransferase [Prevotella sp.]|nr:5-methyltetrahydrofolate--homocysteine methyltransferase [Prevotella sp.]